MECVVISLALNAGFLMLIEFYLVPEHKELLWISLFSIILAGYVGTSGLGSFATLIPHFPWQLAVRLEYIGFAMALPLFLNWLMALYKEEVQYRAIRWFFWVSVAFTLYIILTPSTLFTELLYVLLAFMCASLAMTAWVLFKLYLQNCSGIRVLVFGAFTLMIGILHDLMIFLEVIHSEKILSTGVLIFLVSQIGFLTFYRTQEQIKILDLNHSLQSTTAELEQRIEHQLQELDSTVAALVQSKEEYQRLLNLDELTGLMNRHHFLDLIERRLERMQRFGFSLMIVDIDHHKLIVDHHGREFAESILQRMAQLLEEVAQGYFDRIPAPHGGDCVFLLWWRGDEGEAGR